MSNIIDTVRARLAEVDERMTNINAAAEDRLLTADEKSEVGKLQAEQAELTEELKLREGMVAAKAQASAPQRKATPEVLRPAMSLVQPGPKGAFGFKSLMHFANDVRDSRSGRVSNLLANYIANAASTNQNETTAADGGVLVPTDFRRNIVENVFGR